MSFTKYSRTEDFLRKTGLSLDDALLLSEEQLKEMMEANKN